MSEDVDDEDGEDADEGDGGAAADSDENASFILEELSLDGIEFFNTLVERYRSCDKCQLKDSNSQYCKIIADGTHTLLTSPQLREWAIALAIGSKGVTVLSPPKTESFAIFHHNIASLSVSKSENTFSGLPINTLFKLVPSSYQHHTRGELPSPYASYDTSDSDRSSNCNSYPTTQEYFETLYDDVPEARATELLEVVPRLNVDGLLCINDLLRLTPEVLQVKYLVTEGTAFYILKYVSREVRRIRRKSKVVRKRERSPSL